MAETTIYLVEDDDSIRELVLYALKNSGYRAKGFESGEKFLSACRTEPPALALLDIMLPGEDGLQILRRMREDRVTPQIPVIMLTAKASEYDKVKGLDLGADDYVTKPFGVMELLSRVRAVLRRSGSVEEPATALAVGEIALDESRREVTVAGEQVTLTFKEFELLCFLMRNTDLVLSRDRIMERVWGFDFEGESRTVDMHIKSLRQKLGQQGDAIRTVRGVGYKISVGGGK